MEFFVNNVDISLNDLEVIKSNFQITVKSENWKIKEDGFEFNSVNNLKKEYH